MLTPQARLQVQGRTIIDSLYVTDTAVFNKSAHFKEDMKLDGSLRIVEGGFSIPSLGDEDVPENGMMVIDKFGNVTNGGDLFNLMYSTLPFNPPSPIECLPNPQGYTVYPPHWTAAPQLMYFENTSCNNDPKLGVGVVPTAKLHVLTARNSTLDLVKVERSTDLSTDLMFNIAQQGNVYIKEKVGIGLNPGNAKLHVFSNDAVTSPLIIEQNAAGTLPPHLKLSPTGLLGIGVNPTAKLHVQVDGTTQHHPLIIEKTTAGPSMKLLQLENSGLLRAREIKVDTDSWPDYVFSKEYKLMPLNEVKSYIEKNGHLPNVPKASEIEEDGINLGEAAKTAMEKIEELTLYLLEINEKLETQEQRLQQQDELIDLQQNTIELQRELLEEVHNNKKQ